MKAIFTTSWDDGNPADLRMVKLLNKYGLKGTFYVMYKKIEAGDLDKEYLAHISRNHEVGSHLIDHVDLTKLTASEAFRQLSTSKHGLETANDGVEVQMLSYPWGKYNNVVKALAKKAGYAGARTTKYQVPFYAPDPYELPVTVGVWGDWNGDYALDLQVLKLVSKRGGVFHLAGHCWELDEKKWQRLEDFFKIVSEIPNLTFLTNSEVIK